MSLLLRRRALLSPGDPGFPTPDADFDSRWLVTALGLSDGAAIGATNPWASRVSAHQLVQSARQLPTLKEGVTPNGGPAVFFGGDHNLEGVPTFSTGSSTSLLVFQLTSTDEQQWVLSRRTGTTGADRWYMGCVSDQFTVYSDSASASISSRDTNWHVMVLRGSGTAKRAWLDALSTSFVGSTGTPAQGRLGSLSSNSNPMTGYVAAYQQWFTPLSDAEVAAAMTAASARYLS